MSDVPPDRRSTHELYEELREAGRRKARAQAGAPAAAPRSGRRPLLRSGVLAPALSAGLAFLVVGGGVAVGTRVFVGDDGTTSSVGGGVPENVRRAPGDRRTAQATTVDPGSANARWGMRIYNNEQGDTCLQPGRIVNGRIGAVQAGRFEAYPDDTVGNCADLTVDHAMVTVWVNRLGSEPRSVLYGAVDRTVTGLVLRTDGAERPVPIAADGTYMLVRLGSLGFKGDELVVRRAGAPARPIALQVHAR